MLPLLLLFSVFLLFRGHNEPGGGFSGGLVGAAAFILYALSFGVPAARQSLLVDPRTLVGAGLLVSLGSGLFALLRGQPFLTHHDAWAKAFVPGLGEVEWSTALLFDVGVYLVVAGVTLTITLTLAEE